MASPAAEAVSRRHAEAEAGAEPGAGAGADAEAGTDAGPATVPTVAPAAGGACGWYRSDGCIASFRKVVPVVDRESGRRHPLPVAVPGRDACRRF